METPICHSCILDPFGGSLPHLIAGLTSCAALRSSHWAAECASEKGFLSDVFPKCWKTNAGKAYLKRTCGWCLVDFEILESIGKVDGQGTCQTGFGLGPFLHHAYCIKLQHPTAGTQDIRLGRFFRFSSCLSEHNTGNAQWLGVTGHSLGITAEPSPHGTALDRLGQDAISCRRMLGTQGIGISHRGFRGDEN